ncbi:MAG: acyltransferase [Thaumarchaeota archaeon]|nr:acyltransferase [Nitrososphaerota archaeon]
MEGDSSKNDERRIKVRKEIMRREESRLMTDDERAAFFGLPKGCRMREGVKIYSPENFKCGEYCWFGEDTKLDASGGLEIGDHTTVGSSVLVWSHTSFLTNLTMNNFIGSNLIIRKKTKIGSGVFIVGHAVIYPGVNIGDKCVILPMTVVTEDIPSYSMVSGAPGKVIKTISEEWIREQVERVMRSEG